MTKPLYVNLLLGFLMLITGSTDEPLASDSGLSSSRSHYAKALCAPSKSLTVVARKQETVAWCWVASAQTVMEALPPHNLRQQCDIFDAVRKHHSGLGSSSAPSCCVSNKATTPGCPLGGEPSWALDEYGYKYDVLDDSKFDWLQLTQQICQEQPIIYGESYLTGGGHTYIVRGFKLESTGEKVIEIYDHDPRYVYEPTQTDFIEMPYQFIRLPASGPDPDGRSTVEYYTKFKS